MTRRPVRDERQSELFPLPETSPASARSAQWPKPAKVEPAPQALEVTAEEMVARLAPRDVEDLVRGLPDETLAHLTTAATRELRRRLARSGGQRRGRAVRGGHGTLERAARQVAGEFAEAISADDW
jgi:hypothetical protein